MYTEKELAAFDKIDEAVAEVTSVAKEFARQIGARYYRGGDCWSTHSSFQTSWFDEDGVYHYTSLTRSLTKVSIDTSVFERDESFELAWRLEDEWNKHVEYWNNALDLADEHDMYDSMFDAVLAEKRTMLEDTLGSIVEDWIECASDCVWYEETEGVA